MRPWYLNVSVCFCFEVYEHDNLLALNSIQERWNWFDMMWFIYLNKIEKTHEKHKLVDMREWTSVINVWWFENRKV